MLTCLVLQACTTSVVGPTPLLPEFRGLQPVHPRELPARSGAEPFRFLIGGHLYGDSKKTISPAATFVAAREGLRMAGADLMVCCGDTFRFSTEAAFDQVTAEFAPLPFPVFNAVGNHDVAVRSAYESRFGATYGAFVHGGCAFILLDTEQQPWEIAGEQLAFLRRALAVAAERADVRAVFCFGHKLVHCHRQRYFEVLVGSNALDGLRGPNRFARDVLPLLKGAAKHKSVYWCGGDIGLSHTLHAMVDLDPESGVIFMATGLGDLSRDALLQVEVVGDEVSVRLRSLTGAPLSDASGHGLAKWHERFFPAGLSPQLTALRAILPR
ncbi:MAG: hypothetical protein ACI89X_001031 [Planctomycetota bacterium]|jgi:hypothetical protein